MFQTIALLITMIMLAVSYISATLGEAGTPFPDDALFAMAVALIFIAQNTQKE